MSKKDYELLAAFMWEMWTRNKFEKRDAYIEAVGVLANRLALDNPRFNVDKFTHACLKGLL